MEFSSLTHLISAVRNAVQERRIILFGSSSLFGTFPDDDPRLIGVAVTIDADFFIEPDDAGLRFDLENEFGEDQSFHNATGYYGDFVDLRLSNDFPVGWRDRLVPMPSFDNVFALDPLDMAVTKIAATANSRLSLRMGRGGVDRGMKDINTIVALLKARRIDRAELDRRLRAMDYAPALTVECGKVFEQILRLVDSGG